jgi:hypothetical protein
MFKSLEAIFGWQGGAMASLYTRAADRMRLAAKAMSKLKNEKLTSIVALLPNLYQVTDLLRNDSDNSTRQRAITGQSTAVILTSRIGSEVAPNLTL